MKRHLDSKVSQHFEKYKQVLILLGSRQVGKTTLVKKIFPEADYFLVDNEPIKKIFESYDIETYKTLINKNSKEIIIDEIHLIDNPGRAIKIIYDQLEDLKIIITGSSSFHIKNKTGESLAGRKIDYNIYPLSFSEYLNQKGIEEDLNFNILEKITDDKKYSPEDRLYRFDLKNILNNVLTYGQYPHLIKNPNDEKYLLNFVDSLIFKDILELNLIEDKKMAKDLLKLLAFQIGNLINYSELANSLKADQRTIKRYIEIFEQSFVLFRLYPYSKNKRDEIIKSAKIFFYDVGVRNSLIGDFSDLKSRTDKGALFENFIISELIKQDSYSDKNFKFYYWRTKQGSEMDVVLERGNELIGVEVKYKQKAVNKAFRNRYPEAKVRIVTADNFY
ncbi:MAG: ATP-binding protein [Candidatus Pacebacteria bacterium]|nr:ATP-binding protein [Candidatus Paceibacterota bacterium]